MDIDEIIEFLFLQLKKIFNYLKLDININNIDNILYEIFYNSNNCNYIDKQNILLYIQQYKYITLDLYNKINIFNKYSNDYINKLIFIQIIFYFLSIDLLNIEFDSNEISVLNNFLNSNIDIEIKKEIIAYTPIKLFYLYIQIIDQENIIKLIDLCSINQQIILLISIPIEFKNDNNIIYFIKLITNNINNNLSNDLYEKLFKNYQEYSSKIELEIGNEGCIITLPNYNSITNLIDFNNIYESNKYFLSFEFKQNFNYKIFKSNWLSEIDIDFYKNLIISIYNNNYNEDEKYINECLNNLKLYVQGIMYMNWLYMTTICNYDIIFKNTYIITDIIIILSKILDIYNVNTDEIKKQELKDEIKIYYDKKFNINNKLKLLKASVGNSNIYFDKYNTFKNLYKTVLTNVFKIVKIRIVPNR
jgi:hypothetical protein